ncbi:hypothetical protein Droror1_Dr00028204 [Drosera rotundifolia]
MIRAKKANPQPSVIPTEEVVDESGKAKTVDLQSLSIGILMTPKRTRTDFDEAEFNGKLFDRFRKAAPSVYWFLRSGGGGNWLKAIGRTLKTIGCPSSTGCSGFLPVTGSGHILVGKRGEEVRD